MALPAEFAPGTLIPRAVLEQNLRFCGTGAKVFAGCRIVPAQCVSLGDYSQIDEGVRIFAGQGVDIGRYVHFAMESSVSGGGKLLVEDFASVGIGARLLTGTEVASTGLLMNPTVPLGLRGVRRDVVKILAHAVVFTNAIVFPGVTIGEGAVAAAGAVVHHDLSPWTIYAGHPLVAVGRRNKESVLRAAEECLKTNVEP